MKSNLGTMIGSHLISSPPAGEWAPAGARHFITDHGATGLPTRQCGGSTIKRAGRRPRVIIVGAGLAGTATAIRLLRFAREPLQIILLERRPDYRCAGVAYHRDGNPWDHVFNIQAGRMSMFREDVDDFIRWANLEADRRDWPAPWAELEFMEHGPAPRRIYSDYLADRLAEARREAYPGVEVVAANGEAIDVKVRSGRVKVFVRNLSGFGFETAQDPDLGASAGFDLRVLAADHVVLATGLELRTLSFAADVLTNQAFVRHPYSEAGVAKLLALPPEATVAIVGSVLSAYDTAALLLRLGHTGKIYLISRSGTTLRTYPEDHQHGVVQLPCPMLLLRRYEGRDEFVARVRTEWEAACSTILRDYPEVDRSVVTERVAKAWEPHLPAIIERIPSTELRRLLDEFGTAIAALRVGAVEYTTAIVEGAMSPACGSVELIVGDVERITPVGLERLAVSVAGPASRVIAADLVVSNFGRESDYGRVDSSLWRNLLRRELATPHRRTGRGVEVDEHGILLSPSGERTGPISAVGVLREGDEIVRYGRTGAFTFNLAAIKNHSIAVAAHVVERLHAHHDSVGECAAIDAYHMGVADETTRAKLEEAVTLEVRRLATKARSERERIDDRLDACLLSIGELSTLPTDGHGCYRVIRAVVSRVAVKRLTDVSVTPRQLRQQLGIGSAEDQRHS